MTLVFDRQVFEVEVPTADGSALGIQELYDSIREYEALSANMDLRSLASASGKQSLGGTSQVGITLSMQQTWLVGFAARAGPALIACIINGGNITTASIDTGAVTSSGTTTLVDSSATFARHAVQTGNVIRNVTDGSTATVLTVDSETQITHTLLTGGTGNDWGVADVWEVDMSHPVFPTAFTHVSIAQDTSPLGLTDLGAADLLRKIFLNRAVTTILGDTSKRIDFYDDDQTTIIDSISISIDGNERTNP